MAKIALIGCTKRKKDHLCQAIDLYSESDLFRKELFYAQKVLEADVIYILSAKHGLVEASAPLEPYDETLNNAKVSKRRLWADMVFYQAKNTFHQDDELCFLCGQRYREYLLPLLQAECFNCRIVMPSLPIGELKRWLNTEIEKAEM